MNEQMLSDDKQRLRILDDFIVDTSLPKHASKTRMTSGIWLTSSSGTGLTLNPTGVAISTQPRFLERLLLFVLSKFRMTMENATAVPVQEVFEAIIGRGKRLETLKDRMVVYQSAIDEASASGQVALAEQLRARMGVVQLEDVLFAAGHRQYVDEWLLVEFAGKCERGLALDWLKNFTRMLPHNARIRKRKLDALMVFDNYAVLHYDPSRRNSSMTEKEKVKAKDPILFGLIEGSRRLYHVASWEDEYCDFTFSDLIDKFGREALTLE